jgi:hypothetical protein
MADQNRKNWVLGCCSWGFLLVGADHDKKGGMSHVIEKTDWLARIRLDESL